MDKVGGASLGLQKVRDGKNQFFHVRYSANEDGSNMTEEPVTSTRYIGVLTNDIETPSTNYLDYSWALFVGKDGEDGKTPIKGSDYFDGVAGKDGVGLSNTVLSYAGSTNGTTPPSSGWQSQVPTVSPGNYLWTRTVWHYTDNTSETGYTVSRIGKDGNDGNDGVAGKDGVGIKNTLIEYAAANSGTTKPTTGWTTTIPNVALGDYLWTRTTWTYDDNTTEQGFSVARMGRDGSDGADGIAGKDGVGLEDTSVTYQLHTSGTNPPTGSWSSSVPTLVKGRYLWTKTVWTYTDDTNETGYNVSYLATDGSDGEDGLPGKDGVGIKSTAIHYASSGSGTSKPVSGWTLTIPTVASGSYLWTRTTWTYDDNTTEEGFSVAKMGANGNDGIAGKDGVGLSSTTLAYASSTSQTVAPTSGWQSNVPTVPAGNYLWTRTTWAYTDNTSEVGYTVSRIGKDGNTGKDGIAGKDGVGIANTKVEYVGSTSGTVKPTSGWITTIPSVAEGQYLWTRTTWIYTDNTSEMGYSVAKMGAKGAKGDKGNDGIAGKDGVGLKNTAITYAQNTSGTTAPISGWATNVPTLIKGQYLWTKTVWTYTDDTSETGYTVSYNAKDGNNGTDGIAGKDGVGIKSTLIQYVGSTSGTTKPTSGWSTSIPTVAEGNFLWTKTTWTYDDNSTEEGYSVAKMGTKGAKGDKGSDGADGVSVTSVTEKYAVSSSNTVAPSSWVDTPPATTTTNRYLWNYEIFTYSSGSTTETKKRVIGTHGSTGAAGGNGVGISNVTNYYLVNALSSGVTTATTGWITTPGATTSTNRYLWNYERITFTNGTTSNSTPAIIGTHGITGPQGSQGIQGPKGADGIQRYTWLKYADSPTTGMSDSPTGKAYIGLAYNKTTSTESSNYGDYTWSLIKGEKGDQGVPGAKGTDGIQRYTWIKYADNASGGGMSDSPTNKAYIGLAYNKTTATESSTPGDYVWALIKGANGTNGTSSYTWVRYSANSDGSGMTSNPEANSKYIGIAITTSSNPPTAASSYSWSLIKGDDAKLLFLSSSAATMLFNENNAPSSSQTITITANLQNVTGTATFVARPYIGTTIQAAITLGGSGNSRTLTSASWNASWTSVVITATLGSLSDTITITKVKDGATGPTGQTGPQGPQGATGAKGDPTGIISSSTAPSSPYVGMLWKNTGTAGGRIKDATYRWNGSAWEIFLFTATNISATNLAAISANLGNITAGNIKGATFVSDFNRVSGGDLTQRGTVTIKDGTYSNIYEWYTKSNNQVTQKGEMYLNESGILMSTSQPNNTLITATQFNSNGIFMTDASNTQYGTVQLSYLDLMTIGETQLTPFENFAIYSTSAVNRPTARRTVGRMITLSGAFRNNATFNSNEAGGDGVRMGSVPTWARPSSRINFVVQGTGMNRFLLTIRETGEIWISRYGTTTHNTAVPTGSWLNVACVYTAI